MKKKILAALSAVCIGIINLSGVFDAFASAPQNTSLVECSYITGAKTGNIFSDKDEITFTQNVKNTVNENIVSKYTWNIKDENGATVDSYSWQETMGPKASKIRSITIDNPGKFGIYTINVTEENYKESAAGTKYYDTYTEEFSVCISLASRNIAQDFGFNGKIVNSGNASGGAYNVAGPLMLNAGGKWLRESVMWSGVEPEEEGKYISLDTYKQRLLDLKEEGIETVCVLTGRNKLYDGNRKPTSEKARDAYADFCAYVAEELKGIVTYYEVWNEWNYVDKDNYYLTNNTSAADYVELLKKAYTAIKAVDPGITVIGCNSAGVVPEWNEDVFKALDGGTYMDAMSIHCYDYSETDGFPEEQFISEISELKDLMEEYDLDVPLWLGEVGFNTRDSSVDGFVPACSRESQLNSMVMMRAVDKANSLFDKVLLYTLYDWGDYSKLEYNWGLLNYWKRDNTEKPEAKLVPNGAKPSYLGMAAMNYFVGGNTDYVDMIQDDRSYVFEFYNHNLDKNVILAINGGFNNTVTKELQLGYSNIDIYDKYGNFVRKMESETGNYVIDTYSDPIYIVGNFTELDVDYPDMKLSATVDLNTNEVTITGKTHEPNDIVSIMVVTKGEELAAFDESRLQYLTQTVSDSSGNFSIQYTADSVEGEYQIYANSERRRSKVVDDLEFSYTVPKISVTKNGVPVTGISQLSAGDRPIIRLTGVETTAEDYPKLVVAQYEDGQLKNVLPIDAVGSFVTLGNEFSDDFTVAKDTDKIKIMYWNTDSIMPLAAVYTIE